MPQLVLIALAGVGVVAGFRWLRRQLTDEAPTEPAEAVPVPGIRDLGPLTWDEASKSYRPTRSH